MNRLGHYGFIFEVVNNKCMKIFALTILWKYEKEV